MQSLPSCSFYINKCENFRTPLSNTAHVLPHFLHYQQYSDINNDNSIRNHNILLYSQYDNVPQRFVNNISNIGLNPNCRTCYMYTCKKGFSQNSINLMSFNYNYMKLLTYSGIQSSYIHNIMHTLLLGQQAQGQHEIGHGK